MFCIGPYYGLPSEDGRYAPLFWRSLREPIYLTVRNPRMFDPARHYSFGTNRHFTEISRHEIADITPAMRAARLAFLERFDMILTIYSNHDELCSALSRSDQSFPAWVWQDKWHVAQVVQEEIKSGNLIFVPRNEDLRACVKAIQDDRQRRPAPRQESQPDRFDPRAASQQMYGKPPRMPRNLATPPYSTDAGSLHDAQPFEYQPDDLSGYSFELAGTSRNDMYACDIISSECKGSVLREFPSQYLDSTYNEIQDDARDGVKNARKALKLLNDNRFKK